MTTRALFAAVVVVLATAAPVSARTVSAPRAAAWTLVGEHRADLAGASVAGAGDVNGDGRPDAIVGAPLADPQGRTDAGAAYVVFGGGPRGRIALGRIGARGFRIAGAVPLPARIRHRGKNPFSSGAGSVVAGVGDVNGDGLDDVAVSGREPGGSRGTTTAVFVVFGKRDTTPVDLAALGTGGFVIRSDSDALEIYDGRAVGDVNGDGRADVGVRAYQEFGEDAGYVVLVPGRADSAPVAIDGLPAVTGGAGGMQLGQGLAPAGDVNRDGFGDVLLGAPGTRAHGAVFVLFGSAAPAASILRPAGAFSGFEVNGPVAARGFGFAVARVGRGFVAGAPSGGRGGAWLVPRRDGRPARLAPPRYGMSVAATAGGELLVAGRDRALLYSARGHLRMTYRDLRAGRETPIAVAADGRDVLFGAPGAGRAYLIAR